MSKEDEQLVYVSSTQKPHIYISNCTKGESSTAPVPDTFGMELGRGARVFIPGDQRYWEENYDPVCTLSELQDALSEIMKRRKEKL